MFEKIRGVGEYYEVEGVENTLIIFTISGENYIEVKNTPYTEINEIVIYCCSTPHPLWQWRRLYRNMKVGLLSCMLI